jgi:hypothetical protein
MATLINVYGSARSGSTMLDLILGNAEDAFSCGEVSAWFRPYRRHHSKIDCSCGQDPCPVWERLGDVKESEFHLTVFQEMGVEFVVESSKDICWLLDSLKWTELSGIRAFNLLVWKDPIDLAYSHWKRGGGDWRRHFVRAYGRFFETGLPFSAVNHGRLVQNAPEELAAVCAAVGMTYSAGRERFWEKEHHHLFGSLEVRRQVQRGVSSVKARAPFPPEFEAQRPALEERIASDAGLQEVLRALRRADVHRNAAEDTETRPQWRRKLPPLWYHWKKMVRLARRYVPERYDTTVP